MYAASIPALKLNTATPIIVFDLFAHISSFTFQYFPSLKVYAALILLTTKYFRKTIDFSQKCVIIQKLRKYNPCEGVACAFFRVASQHTDFGLACFKMRDSCILKLYMESFYIKFPSIAGPLRSGFCFLR